MELRLTLPPEAFLRFQSLSLKSVFEVTVIRSLAPPPSMTATPLKPLASKVLALGPPVRETISTPFRRSAPCPDRLVSVSVWSASTVWTTRSKPTPPKI